MCWEVYIIWNFVDKRASTSHKAFELFENALQNDCFNQLLSMGFHHSMIVVYYPEVQID